MSRNAKRRAAKNAEVRLLPAVIGVGAILLGLKAGGLAFSASAATNAPAAQAEAAAQPKPTAAAGQAKAPAGAPTAKVQADPLAAINAALPIPPAKPTAPGDAAAKPADLPPDLASTGITSAEVDVLTSLAERRDALEERQRQLDLRTNMIAATEKRVDDKIAQLKALQTKIESLLGQVDAKQVEQLDGLVKIYTAMKPKDAARVLSALDDSVRLGVAGRFKPDAMAGIMAALPPEVATKLSVELANRYKMPGDIASAAAAVKEPAPVAPAAARGANAAQAPAAGAAKPPGG
jgi:flagellar motility protein MotE (MotC chaperone)